MKPSKPAKADTTPTEGESKVDEQPSTTLVPDSDVVIETIEPTAETSDILDGTDIQKDKDNTIEDPSILDEVSINEENLVCLPIYYYSGIRKETKIYAA